MFITNLNVDEDRTSQQQGARVCVLHPIGTQIIDISIHCVWKWLALEVSVLVFFVLHMQYVSCCPQYADGRQGYETYKYRGEGKCPYHLCHRRIHYLSGKRTDIVNGGVANLDTVRMMVEWNQKK